MFRILAPTAFLIFAAALALGNPAPAPPPYPAGIQQILSDPALWGRDTLGLFARLNSWTRVSDTQVQIFPASVFGASQFKSAADAKPIAGTLATALNGAQPGLNAAISAALKPPARAVLAKPQVQVIPINREDEATRIAWGSDTAQFFAPGLTVETVRRRLGEPEKVSRKAVQRLVTDKRPIGLTLYSYAGGAIVFAESNMTRTRGLVDRVILDIPAVSAVLFKGAK